MRSLVFIYIAVDVQIGLKVLNAAEAFPVRQI